MNINIGEISNEQSEYFNKIEKELFDDEDIEGFDDEYDGLSDAMEWGNLYRFAGRKAQNKVLDKIKRDGFTSASIPDFHGDGGDSVTIVFKPKNIRSIHAAFDPDLAEAPGLLASMEESFSTFFSGMGKALAEKIPGTIPAEQLAEQLQTESTRGKWGIKAEEVEWTGIVEWLHEQEGNVTKQDIAEFVEANQVKVEEVELAEDRTLRSGESTVIKSGLTLAQAESALSRDEEGAWYMADNGDGTYDIIEDQDDLQPTKYKEYVVPGAAENYRELLLTLPVERVKKPYEQWLKENFTGEDTKQARDLYKTQVAPDAPLYYSHHFNERNVLAHVRFDERVDADGNKVLFINEIQSDWMKAIRSEKKKIADYANNNFESVVSAMKKAGVLEVDC